jgi:hypothetical protein
MENPVPCEDIREFDGEGLSGQPDLRLLQKHDFESDDGVSEAQVGPQSLELHQAHGVEYEDKVDIRNRPKLPFGRGAEQNC